jgi:5,6-dimethylbenzimidazole synthase
VLRRILGAAHTAPSAGLSSPGTSSPSAVWTPHTAFRDHVQAEREIFARQLDEQQTSTFARIKAESVLESSPGEGALIGRRVRS